MEIFFLFQSFLSHFGAGLGRVEGFTNLIINWHRTTPTPTPSPSPSPPHIRERHERCCIISYALERSCKKTSCTQWEEEEEDFKFCKEWSIIRIHLKVCIDLDWKKFEAYITKHWELQSKTKNKVVKLDLEFRWAAPFLWMEWINLRSVKEFCNNLDSIIVQSS